jgi:hypothetical protein
MKRATIEAAAKATPKLGYWDEPFEKGFKAGAAWALAQVREWAKANDIVRIDLHIEDFCTIEEGDE